MTTVRNTIKSQLLVSWKPKYFQKRSLVMNFDELEFDELGFDISAVSKTYKT